MPNKKNKNVSYGYRVAPGSQRQCTRESSPLGSPYPLGGGDDDPSGLVAEQLIGGVFGKELGGFIMNR